MKLPDASVVPPPGGTTVDTPRLRLLLVTLAIAGMLLSAYVFFLPYDTIADEEEYLSEVFSAAQGHPSGWGIRHLLYPLLISPFVALASAAGSPVESLASIQTQLKAMKTTASQAPSRPKRRSAIRKAA